jgi:hypothetical protein
MVFSFLLISKIVWARYFLFSVFLFGDVDGLGLGHMILPFLNSENRLSLGKVIFPFFNYENSDLFIKFIER